MATPVPPNAIGKVLKDRCVADADAFEKFANHYTESILTINKKCTGKSLKENKLRRSERLLGKKKIVNQKVAKNKTKRSLSTSSDSDCDSEMMHVIEFSTLKAKRLAELNKMSILSSESSENISDDEQQETEIIDLASEEINSEPAANIENIQIPIENIQIPIEVDSSSDEEIDENEWKGSQLCKTDNETQAVIQTDVISIISSIITRPPFSPIDVLPYAMPEAPHHEAYILPPKIVQSPIEDRHYNYQAPQHQPHSDLYLSNQSSQQCMTPSTSHSLSTPEQVSHNFSEELPNSYHCVLQFNKISPYLSRNRPNPYFNPGLDLIVLQVQEILRVAEEEWHTPSASMFDFTN